MKLRDILAAVHAESIYIEDEDVLDIDFKKGFATDLMSDALYHLRDADDDELLITGLANMQIIHTASTLDLPVILLVRGKPIDEVLIKGAKMNEISIFKTDYTMFEACGRLFEAGLGKDV